MKIIKKEDSNNTTFGKIEFGECFKIKDTEAYFMKTPLTASPVSDREWNSVYLSTGHFDYFIDEQEVIKVDCELIIK